jgi:hypothetical protein
VAKTELQTESNRKRQSHAEAEKQTGWLAKRHRFFFPKRAALTRRSTVLSLPLQLMFLAQRHGDRHEEAKRDTENVRTR